MMSSLRTLTSDLLSRARWSALLKTFDGARDLNKVLGYATDLSTGKYRERYLRNGMATRIVETFPDLTWRGGAELIENEDPDTFTPFEQAWDELNDRLQIWSVFRRADILAGLGRYSVILLGVPGNFEEPLENAGGPDKLLYLSTFAEDEAIINTWVEDTKDPRFGLPLTYKLKRLGSTKGADRTVHWSRIIHIADGVLDEIVYGKPRLQNVWNWLDDLDKIVGGGSEASWKRADQGMQIDVDPEITLDDAAQKKLQDEVDEYINGLKRIVRTQGVKMNALGSDVSTFSQNASTVIDLISASTGIPQRVLMGSERGELASTQDKQNLDDRVSDRRDSFAKPMVVRPFVNTLIAVGVLPEPKQYDPRWPDQKEMTETERVSVASGLAAANASQANANGEIIITTDEIRDRYLELPPLKQQPQTKQLPVAAIGKKKKTARGGVRSTEPPTLELVRSEVS